MPLRRNPEIVRALEYARISLPPRVDNARGRARLEATALQAGVRALEVRGQHLYARGVVGVIDVGDIVVEILPKTHDDATATEGAAFLVGLLGFVDAADGVALLKARIASGEHGLLETILSWATRSIALNVREGLPRRYEIREEISTAVRGRVELRQIARQRPGRAFEVAVRHAPLSDDNPIGQIVRWLLTQIDERTRLIQTKALCQRVLQELDHVRDVAPTTADFTRLILHPLDERWRPLLDFARSLLSLGRPDPTRAGELPAVAVLFTLHDLFEAALRRVLGQGLGAHGLRLQGNAGHLLRSKVAGEPPMLRLKPDFRVAEIGEPQPLAVGDAKWKRILGSIGPARLLEADAYQITTYMTALQAGVGYLFCPLSQSSAEALRHVPYELEGVGKPLHVIGIHLPTLIATTDAGVLLRRALCADIASTLVQAEDAVA